jgi:hypothetical protein
MLCNVVTYQARNTVREVGKAMSLPADLIDRVARSLDAYSAAGLEESLSKLTDFQDRLGSQSWAQFLEMCRQIAGFPRHLGIHVGGMIISTTPLNDILPLEWATMPGRVVTQWDKDDISDVEIAAGGFDSLLMLTGQHQTGNRSHPAAGETEKPFRVIPQCSGIERSLAFAVAELGLTDEAAQVGVAGQVLDQENKVVAFVQRHLRTYNRFDPLFFGRVAELHHAVQPVVVGEGERRHAQLPGSGHQIVRGRGPVEKREIAVAVKLNVHG